MVCVWVYTTINVINSLITKFCYLDAVYTKEFCVKNPVLVSNFGCSKFKTAVCVADLQLAQSETCAGQLQA